jgi:phosphoglycerate dehydrogenase-like enzyme
MKPKTIIASLPQDVYENFFDKVINYQEILPTIYRVDPGMMYTYLVQQINQSQSEILLTGWGAVALPESFLSDCPTIRYVCHLTGEMRWLLPRKLIEEGLLVTNWGASISDGVAEGTLFLILACCRRAVHTVMTLHVRKGWELDIAPPVSLLDKRVGIHGFGNIAHQLSLLLKPFRCTVSAYSPPVPDRIFTEYGVQRETSLERLFGQNDIIVEVEALTPATRGMVGKDLLERINPGGIFVNSGRGKVVNQVALEEVASRGFVFMGLDVYDQEPLSPDSPLRGLENVYLSPHLAGPTLDHYLFCAEHALANIAAYIQGRPLKGIINVEVYDRIT